MQGTPDQAMEAWYAYSCGHEILEVGAVGREAPAPRKVRVQRREMRAQIALELLTGTDPAALPPVPILVRRQEALDRERRYRLAEARRLLAAMRTAATPSTGTVTTRRDAS